MSEVQQTGLDQDLDLSQTKEPTLTIRKDGNVYKFDFYDLIDKILPLKEKLSSSELGGFNGLAKEVSAVMGFDMKPHEAMATLDRVVAFAKSIGEAKKKSGEMQN